MFSLLVFGLFLSAQNYTNAEENLITTSTGVEMTQSEHDHLQKLGFTDLAIDQISQDVFEENKDIVVSDQSEETKYYEIQEVENSDDISSYLLEDEDSNYITTELTEDEYFKRVAEQNDEVTTFASSDTTKTSYRRLTTTVSKINKTTARIHSKFIWDKMPATRSHDVLSTSIKAEFTPVPGSNYAQQLWAYSRPNTGGGLHGDNASYKSSSSKWNKKAAGYGVKMNLKNNGSNYRVNQLEGYAYYNVKRDSSVIPKYVNAYGNYSHAKKSVSPSFSYGISFGGPSLSWSGISSKSFDTITTHAQVKY